MKKKPENRNMWTTLGFVAFGSTAVYMLAAILIQKTKGIAMPSYWLLLGASLFVAFMTTGAMKGGGFFGRFYKCTKEMSPISFWSQAIFGYLFAGAIGVFFLYQLSK